MKRTCCVALAMALVGTADPTGACTLVGVGKKASADGSVIVAHTDTGPNSRLIVVPGRRHEPGEMAPVHWGIQDPSRPLDDFGEVLGHIPQVARTSTYIHSAYPHINEHQLAIGESTTVQRAELALEKGDGEQIMTIEQAQAFALQRCKTARDAVTLIGGLMTTYGFLPSSGDGSEALIIGDTQEAWVFEVFGVGKGWTRASGRPGAIWAAQRLPDDHACMIPNWSIIKEIDPSDRERFPGLGELHERGRRPRLVRPHRRQAVHLAGGLRAAAGRVRDLALLALLQHLHAQPGRVARPLPGQRPGQGHEPVLPDRRAALPLPLLRRARVEDLGAGRDAPSSARPSRAPSTTSPAVPSGWSSTARATWSRARWPPRSRPAT